MNYDKNQKIQTIPLDYSQDLSVSLFAPIASTAWSMLLRSASDHHADSRFDILVAQPIATLVTVGEETTITVGETKQITREDPFTLIEEQVRSLLPTIDNSTEFPFIGGALGYFGYDLGRRIETLPTLATKELNTPDMAIGLYDWAVIVDHQQKSAHVVGQNVEVRFNWLRNQQSNEMRPFVLTSKWQSNMSKHSYTGKFDKVMQYLLSGDCYQINLAQRYVAKYQGCVWQAYQQLEQNNQAPFSAFIQLEDSAVLSVSPERFLKIEQNRIETKPIKGTRPRSNDPAIDMANVQNLINTEKDQAENLMIVDLLRNDIGRVAKPGSVKVPALFQVESFPAVHHLVSTVTAELDLCYSVTDCLRACFPGGSITGAPKVRAMQIIEELEPHRRSVYCGSIGYISRCGNMDTNIAIRTLVANDKAIYAWAGGGLVADSEVESEYQETIDKLSKILPILDNHR